MHHTKCSPLPSQSNQHVSAFIQKPADDKIVYLVVSGICLIILYQNTIADMSFTLLLLTVWIFILEYLQTPLSAVTTLRPGGSRSLIEKYLTQFGYIDVPDQGNQSGMGRSMVIDPKQVSDGIKLLQEKYGLIVTGVLDDATLKQIQKPRCGVKDILTRSTFPKWADSHLKYKFVGRLTHHLKSSTVKEAIQSGFKYWSEVTPLTFTEVYDDEKAHLILRFGRYSHGDDYPFDGPDGTLAHAFFPSDGRIHFDLDEVFTEGEDRGYNLRIVAAHEIGHALGLPHSYNPEALMAALYAGYTDKNIPLLAQDDIYNIQRIYGPRQKSTTPLRQTKTTRSRRMTRITDDFPMIVTSPTKIPAETTITNTPTIEIQPVSTEGLTTILPMTTTEEKEVTEGSVSEGPIVTRPTYYTHHQWPNVVPGHLEPDICSTKTTISAAFMGKDSHVYFLIKHQDILWVYQNVVKDSRITSGWPYKLRDFFKTNIPSLIDAALYVTRTYRYYLFSGTKVFVYGEFGYFQGDFVTTKNVSYAFNHADGKAIVVTKDDTAWEFNPWTYEFKDSQPVSNLFPGIPVGIDAAAEDYPWAQDINFIFFFKGREYYKYDPHKKKRISSGDVGGPFFGCRQFPVPKFL